MRNFIAGIVFTLLLLYCFYPFAPVLGVNDLPTSAPSDLSAQELLVGFSPEGSAQEVVLDTIERARQEICVMSYSFTSPQVVQALISASKRKVTVKIVVDKNGNTGRASIAALNALKNAGIAVRVNDSYRIQHDKIIISDQRHVQTGSFNYTSSADKFNSENVIEFINNPRLAEVYLEHFNSRWNEGENYQPAY